MNSTDEARAAAADRFFVSVVDRNPALVEAQLRNALDTPSLTEAGRVEVMVSLARVLMFRRKSGEALELARSVLAARPDHEAARMCDAELSFQLGETWPLPWHKLEACQKHTQFPLTPSLQWDGSELGGKSVLLVGEVGLWGLGDQVQFLRFVQLLRAAGAGRVIAQADIRLHGLLRTMAGIDEIVSAADTARLFAAGEVGFDVSVDMVSVPSRVGMTQNQLPAEPYLAVPGGYVEAARSRIADPGEPDPGEPDPGEPDAGERRLNIGIAWRAGKQLRSIPSHAFARIRDLPGVRLFGLGERALIEGDCAALGITSLGSEDVLATAGAIEALDLTISTDTMIAHLAGALGRPVWTLLNEAADFRWPLAGDSTCWYPTMRLFHRQEGNWEGVVGEVACAVEDLVLQRS